MKLDVSEYTPGTQHSLKTFVDIEDAYTEGGVRWIIFQHKDKLIEKGAIYYVGRKIVIDSPKFISCMKEGLVV